MHRCFLYPSGYGGASAGHRRPESGLDEDRNVARQEMNLESGNDDCYHVS